MSDKYKQPLVTTQFYGQLGNQLFILSTALSYAWEHNATPIFPGLNTPRNRTSYNKDRLFFRLDASNPPRQFKNLFRQALWHKYEKIPFLPDLVLDGYFQSWKYFHNYREKLLEVFAPSQVTEKYLQDKYADLLKNPNTVGVHVRTAGKTLHANRSQPFLGLEYYRKAFSMFPDDTTFVLCADRINWCKKHFPAVFGKKFVFIEGNYGIEDMFLLARCKHIIIANSTFSWWAAYLNQNPGKRVIVPNVWGGDPAPPEPPLDLFLPEWEVVTVPPFEPYPEDMYDYGETQSWDGNW